MNILSKKEVFVIGEKIIPYDIFYSLVDMKRKEIKNKEKIKLCPSVTLDFLVNLWASLLEQKHIDLDVDASEEFLLESINNLSESNSYYSLLLESKFQIKFQNEIYTAIELTTLIEKFITKKIINKKDTFCFLNKNCLKKESIETFIFYTIIPIMIEAKFIFTEEIGDTFKRFKPTIFMGNRKDIKLLHNLMLKVPNSSNLVENFYHLFRKPDNYLWGQLINRFLIFDGFRSLKSVIVNEIKDLNGLWIDFESLGIDIYALRYKEEKNIKNEDD